MSVSEMIIKLLGVGLAIVGFLLLLAAVGINLFGVGVVINPIVAIIVGLIFLGCGIFVVRGGNIVL